eukprot:snap_masked-scaffold_40-processed-gene-1.24-mRNA-1 protein AED:1.00 eAED:1.00 QI:0/-1/0/0/-1/1/1/0/114
MTESLNKLFEKEKDDTSSLDSDDPELWGPYYWNEEKSSVSTGRKVMDQVKYASFKTFRGLSFTGEVLFHFFGLNKSKYQWVADVVEKQKDEDELNEKIYLQKKEIREKKDSQGI